MDSERLRALIAEGEGAALALFPDQSDVARLAETLAALANHGGGVLVVGATPTGRIVGLADPDATERALLEAMLAVEPPLTGGILRPVLQEVDGHSLLVAALPPHLEAVYRSGERYLTRDGTENRPLETSELRRLILSKQGSLFEREVPPGATPGDLSRSAIEAYLDRVPGHAGGDSQSGEAVALLRRRGILRQSDGRPTYAGLLLFGREPQQWLPSAQILVARYPGTEMGDTFLRQEIGGTLPQQIVRAETFVLENMRRQVVMRDLQRDERLEYPREAVREAIVNAVAHRDYGIRGAEVQIFMFSDRIEIHSPGRLAGHVTVRNIQEERYSRNEAVVQTLSDLGYIERLGYGVDRIMRLAEEQDLPPPEFAESANGFRVTLFGPGDTFQSTGQFVAVADAERAPLTPSRWHGLGLNPRQLDALAFVERDGRITNRDYQELAPDVSPETLRRDLADLVERGFLLRIGEKRATYYILK